MRCALLALLAGCHLATSGGPLALSSIEPAQGSVGGGTTITLHGSGFADGDMVTIGGVPCTQVHAADDHLTCITGDRHFQEGTADVTVTDGASTASLTGAYTYACLWKTSQGRTSCGAVPPGKAPEQTVAMWMTQDEPGNSFTANPGVANLADTSDVAVGSQAAVVTTDGIGTTRSLARISMPAFDFTKQTARLWLKIEGVARIGELEVQLGDSNLANAFVFDLRSGQSRQWITEGDWVSFAIPWHPDQTVGTPNRAAITDVMVRVADNRTGPLTLHLNAIALVPEAAPHFPNGVVSFTFDDGFATQNDVAAPILAAKGFTGTAYVIVDEIDKPDRLSLSELKSLTAAGWDIGAHAYTQVDHALHFTELSPNEVEDDMVNTRAWLIANQLTGYDHCAYPSGEFDRNVLALAGTYFTSCRTIYAGQQELFPPSDSRRLRVGYITSSVPLSVAQEYVEEARENHEWLILVFHKLVDGTPAASTEWRTADFQALVDQVAASGLPVATVTDVYATSGDGS
ncbi:MAG: IPT/TIG domain-containing protein [Deltaproteobacteria bacterium]|nr:IPT/TIG domain-containing protein [Deltaproteobacteria bacterium]